MEEGEAALRRELREEGDGDRRGRDQDPVETEEDEDDGVRHTPDSDGVEQERPRNFGEGFSFPLPPSSSEASRRTGKLLPIAT